MSLDRGRLQAQDLGVVHAEALSRRRAHALIIACGVDSVTPFFMLLVGYAKGEQSKETIDNG
jgi:hypothetical protein